MHLDWQDKLPSDSLHDSLLNNKCLQLVRSALEADQYAAAERQAAAAAARSDRLPQLDMQSILHILSFLPDWFKGRQTSVQGSNQTPRCCIRVDLACNSIPKVCDVELLQQCVDDKHMQHRLMAEVAGKGDLPKSQFLHQQGCKCDDSMCCAAAGEGQLLILRWSVKTLPAPVRPAMCLSLEQLLAVWRICSGANHTLMVAIGSITTMM